MKISASQLIEIARRLPRFDLYPHRSYRFPVLESPEIIPPYETLPPLPARRDILFTRNDHTLEWELDFDQFK